MREFNAKPTQQHIVTII